MRFVVAVNAMAKRIEAALQIAGGESFPTLAFEAVKAFASEDKELHLDALEWLAGAEAIPAQRRSDNAFGSPNLTIYRSGGFTVELLFWNVGSTAIHEHAFEGAFAVLKGSSIHCVYEFTHDDQASGPFSIGRLALVTSEHLTIGSSRLIMPAGALIHSLFHCDTPTVSIVVRRDITDTVRPEYAYIYPGVRIDPRSHNDRVRQCLQGLDVLQDNHPRRARSFLQASTARGDLVLAYRLLSRFRERTRTEEQCALYDELIEEVFTTSSHIVKQAIEEQCRITLLQSLRGRLISPASRFCVALLMAIPEAGGLFDVCLNPATTCLLGGSLRGALSQILHVHPDALLSLTNPVERVLAVPVDPQQPNHEHQSPTRSGSAAENIRAALLAPLLRTR